MAATASSPEDAEYRAGVGIMLVNARGEVFVGRRIDVEDAWQMPQGGIDEGETPEQAAFRELREEIGTDKAEILAESQKWLHYDLPKELAGKAWARSWRGQRQKWFVMRFKGSDRDINLDTAHPEFSAWKWVPAKQLPRLIVSFKRQVYVDLLSEFSELGARPDRRFVSLIDDPITRMVMEADHVDETELYELLRRVSDRLSKSRS